MFYAVHLEQVYAESLEHLEPNGRPSKPVFGLMRIERAMAERHRKKEWTK